LKTAGVGTLIYAAPELFPTDYTSEEAVERVRYQLTADVYSLTLILHELFGGGATFFSGHCATIITLMTAKSRRVEPKLKLDSLPQCLQTIIRRGVDADPRKRPSLEEFREAIGQTGNPDEQR
jgi:serine/threonine protein kinase